MARAVVVLLSLVGAHELLLQHRHIHQHVEDGDRRSRAAPLASAAAALAPPPAGRLLAQPPQDEPLCASSRATVRVACVGDSLTRGDGSHEPRRPRNMKNMKDRGNYPAALQALLGSEYEVRNFGHGGSTACNTSDNPYVGTAEWAAALAFRPDVAVLMLGTNDAKVQHWEQPHCGGADRYSAGVRQLLLQLVERAGAPFVLVLHPPPIVADRWGIAQRLLPAVRAALRDTLPAAGAEGGGCGRGRAHLRAEELPLRPAAEVFVKDGIHLNKRGSRQLACAVLEELVGRCAARCGAGSQPGRRRQLAMCRAGSAG